MSEKFLQILIFRCTYLAKQKEIFSLFSIVPAKTLTSCISGSNPPIFIGFHAKNGKNSLSSLWPHPGIRKYVSTFIRLAQGVISPEPGLTNVKYLVQLCTTYDSFCLIASHYDLCVKKTWWKTHSSHQNLMEDVIKEHWRFVETSAFLRNVHCHRMKS